MKTEETKHYKQIESDGLKRHRRNTIPRIQFNNQAKTTIVRVQFNKSVILCLRTPSPPLILGPGPSPITHVLSINQLSIFQF